MDPNKTGLGCGAAIAVFLLTGGIANSINHDPGESLRMACWASAGAFVLIAFWDTWKQLLHSKGGSVGRVSRVDPYLPGLHHEQTHECVCAVSLIEAADILERFVRRYLYQWRRSEERISETGTEAYLRFDYEFSRTTEVRPHSIVAGMKRGLDTYQGAPLRAITSVPYELQCHVTLRQEEERVRVTVQVIEDIDRMHRCTEFPLGHHFLAPSYLYTEGYFGVEIEAFFAAEAAR